MDSRSILNALLTPSSSPTDVSPPTQPSPSVHYEHGTAEKALFIGLSVFAFLACFAGIVSFKWRPIRNFAYGNRTHDIEGGLLFGSSSGSMPSQEVTQSYTDVPAYSSSMCPNK